MIRSVRGTVISVVKTTAPLWLLWFFCEFLIYYIVLWQCHYPLIQGQDPPNALKAMFLADTHLLGSREGHWFDKLRREWAMHRAFQTSMTYFHPELVVFLGDVFDEGKWCSDDEFQRYLHRFYDLFQMGDDQELRVVAGNHDMGFHYAVTPHLKRRFQDAFESPSVERFVAKGVQFVSVNSMAMQGDDCFLCKPAREKLRDIGKELDCLEDKEHCEVEDLGLEVFNRPILLQHFPLFRKSDADCLPDFDEAPDKKVPFREGWDCLTEESSQELLTLIKPRLVLSGHTHHGCRLKHGNIPEWSVSSFSWRNRNNPTFILATITPEDYALEKCFLPEEDTVIQFYIVGAIFSLFWWSMGCIRRLVNGNRRRRVS